MITREAQASLKPRMSQRRRRWFRAFLKGAVACGLSAGLLWALVAGGRVEPGRLLTALEHPWWLALAQLCFLAQLFFTFVRWRCLLLAFHVPTSFADVIRLSWIGLLFSQVIPGATGGDVVKGFYIAREAPTRRAAAVLSVILDRVIGVAGLMVLGLLALIVNARQTLADPTLLRVAIGIGLLFSLVLAGGVILSWESLWRHPRWRRFRERVLGRVPGHRIATSLMTALWELSAKRRTLLATTAISVVAHTFGVLMNLCAARALLGGDTPTAAHLFLLVPVGQLAAAIPLTPAGAGVGEAAYSLLFESVGQARGGDLMLLVRVSWIFWALIGIYFYVRGRKELEEVSRATEEEGNPADLTPLARER